MEKVAPKTKEHNSARKLHLCAAKEYHLWLLFIILTVYDSVRDAGTRFVLQLLNILDQKMPKSLARVLKERLKFCERVQDEI